MFVLVQQAQETDSEAVEQPIKCCSHYNQQIISNMSDFLPVCCCRENSLQGLFGAGLLEAALHLPGSDADGPSGSQETCM